MHASFTRHRFAPHLHDAWSIGAVLSGAQDNGIGSDHNIISAGQLILIPPYRPHAGHAIGSIPCRYVMMYVDDAQLRERAKNHGIEDVVFPASGVSDPWLAELIASYIFSVIENDRTGSIPAPALELAFQNVVDQVLTRHATLRRAHGNDDVYGQRYAYRLDGALQYLKEHLSEAVSLNELARRASLSPAHFCRRFCRTYGLPPHRYQLVLRIAQAKSMLYAGEDVGRVAMRTGFADQSHFGRQFKSCFGFSPGQLTRKSLGRDAVKSPLLLRTDSIERPIESNSLCAND